MIHDESCNLWLVYCAGRPTQTTVHHSEGSAQAGARRLAHQWPGHTFVVFKATSAYTADRGPRPDAPSAPPGTQHY